MLLISAKFHHKINRVASNQIYIYIYNMYTLVTLINNSNQSIKTNNPFTICNILIN